MYLTEGILSDQVLRVMAILCESLEQYDGSDKYVARWLTKVLNREVKGDRLVFQCGRISVAPFVFMAGLRGQGFKWWRTKDRQCSGDSIGTRANAA